MGTNQRSHIVMTDHEITDFVARSQRNHGDRRDRRPTASGGDVVPVAGDIWVETKVKSQKVVNIRRNPRELRDRGRRDL